MKRIWIAALLFCAASGSAFAKFQSMQPGKWLITSTTRIPSVPYPMPSMSRTTCISAVQARNHGAVPMAQHGCSMKSHRISGDTMTWTMGCPHGQVISGTMTSTGTTYHADMTTENMGRTMHTIVDGKRLGACR